MRATRWLRPWPAVALAAMLVSAALPFSGDAGASNPRVTVERTLPITSGDTVVNKVITTSLDVALTERHADRLAPFIASLGDTASLNYHHYLTPATFASRFGASATTVHAVRDYLASFGLRDATLSRAGIILHVTGTTTAIARALDAPVETIRLSSGALTAHLQRAATMPASLARDVVAVAGLTTVLPESTNLTTPKSLPASAHASTAPGSCPSAGDSTGTTPNSLGGYTVQQQAALYGLSTQWAAGDTGVGQTIGIYELANYDSSDLDTYFNCYGLTPSLTATNVDGGPSGADDADGNGIEATLDVEEAAALAPGANLEVYQGTQSGSGPIDTYAQIASDDDASIISTSWGICEADTEGTAQVEQPIFEEMATQGQTVVAAAGDSGSSDCADVPGPDTAAVDDPASQPYVTGVGGLTVSDTDPLIESVWNDQCTARNCGAGGGGVSSFWSRPTWQVASSINPATETMRMVPDLSVMGDPSTGFILYYTGAGPSYCSQGCPSGWSGIGGTSIGAPIVSALVASAAQSCGGARLGFVNPALYAMSPSGYVDVSTGNNDLYDIGVYSAGPGYDLASGLGSPAGAAFFSGLCAATYSASNSSFKLSSTVGAVNTNGPSVTATLRDANDKPITNAALSVSASASAGTLTIDGDAASATGTGVATESLVSNASGVVTFTVASTVVQSVAVAVTFEGQTIYSTAINFRARAVTNTRPGAPSIAVLKPLVRGFTLKVRAPASDGGRAITHYQYSLNAGATWHALARGHTTVNVGSLRALTVYHVVARALNAIGASKSSAPKNVRTRG